VLVSVGFLMMAVIGGAVFYGFGIFFQPMATDLGWNRGVTASALSIMLMTNGGVAPLVAPATNRWGVRLVTVLGYDLLLFECTS
jgi:hypothetical protein